MPVLPIINSMKRVLFFSLFLALGIAGWYAYKKYNEKGPDLSRAQPTIRLEAASLIGAFESDTAVASRMYIDQVIAVTGTVKSIDTDRIPVIIFLGEEAALSSVKCSMDPVFADGYKNISKGSRVTVKGLCNGFQYEELLGTDVELNRCVIP